MAGLLEQVLLGTCGVCGGWIPAAGFPGWGRVCGVAIVDEAEAAADVVDVQVLRSLVHDYEHGGSLEVQCAHDADKLDCLFQAIEYRDNGHQNVAGWIGSSRTGLRTKTAVQLADAAIAMSSQHWHNTVMSEPG